MRLPIWPLLSVGHGFGHDVMNSTNGKMDFDLQSIDFRISVSFSV